MQQSLWATKIDDFCEGGHSPQNLDWYRESFRHPLTPPLHARGKLLMSKYSLMLPRIERRMESIDGTIKLLINLSDGKQIETVIIPFHRKYTICLSSQVGCQVKCSFCRTGLMKTFRQLKSQEILEQYLLAREEVRLKNPFAPDPNIVFMGQGEPLQNFQELSNALKQFLHPEVLNLGPRQITISTAGHLPGIERFRELGGVNFALSLHNAIQEEREEIIPLARQFSLTELHRELSKIPLKKRQFITLEYLILGGKNHFSRHAQALREFSRQLPVIINLIPYNPFPGGPYKRPTSLQVQEFKQELVSYRLPTMIRMTKGDDILGACGQLISEELA